MLQKTFKPRWLVLQVKLLSTDSPLRQRSYQLFNRKVRSVLRCSECALEKIGTPYGQIDLCQLRMAVLRHSAVN